jgi:putative membrane protein
VSHQDNIHSSSHRGKWWQAGKTPDYRFTLANERTFLAWIRTALALMAGAVGIDQFSPHLSSPELRMTLALLLLTAAASMGFLAWRRWRKSEYAMRMDHALPYTRAVLFLGGFIIVLAFLLGILLWQGQP